MNISYNWLNKFINLDLSPAETAEKLTLIGLEVDEVLPYGQTLEGVVVGEILEIRDHSNADRLQICIVDAGTETQQIVCGANNIAVNQKVAVATVGAVLPPATEGEDPFTIKQAKLRGEESYGMICAEDELGLGEDHSGIMVLEDPLTPGTPLTEALELYQDTIFDVELTPNRSDAACHLGVARDLAAALDLELNKPFATEFKEQKPFDEIDISIADPQKCHRYLAKYVENVTIGDSPMWLQNQLNAIGISPVNNVVDITNFVMHELGQPLHAFDADTLQGDQIIVQSFDQVVTFETLDHIERNCSAGTLFICDHEGPIAMAGVMGGVDTEVNNQTKNVLIESAWFDPGTIRQTAKEQQLQSDASYRFERGVDPQIQRIAAERAAQLMADICDGTIVEACTDVHPVQPERRELNLRSSYVNRLLGTDFNTDEIAQLLDGLGLHLLEQNEDELQYKIPSFRLDLEREVDLIEEVGRLYDYNNISAPSQTAFSEPDPLPPWEKFKSKVRDLSKGLRYREIYSNSLIPEEAAERLGKLDKMVHTLNPISHEMNTLRPSLLHGFLKSVGYNFNRKEQQLRFFEIGNVFKKAEHGTYHKGIKEQTNILFGLAGFKHVEHWKTDPVHYDAFDLKASVRSFLTELGLKNEVTQQVNEQNTLHYYVDEHIIGSLYTISSSMLEQYDIEYPAIIAELNLSQIHIERQRIGEQQYEAVSKFPAFDFDFAVIVKKSVKAGDLLKTIQQKAGPSLEELQIFDVFEGQSLDDGKKSIAFRLSFLDKNKTLTIKDVEPIIKKVISVLEKKYSAKLRS